MTENSGLGGRACGDDELVAAVRRLELRCAGCGLADFEVAGMLGLAPGDWTVMRGRVPGLALPAAVERGARHLSDVLSSACAIFGDQAIVGSWIRHRSQGAGVSPLEFMTMESDGIAAIRYALARECLNLHGTEGW